MANRSKLSNTCKSNELHVVEDRYRFLSLQMIGMPKLDLLFLSNNHQVRRSSRFADFPVCLWHNALSVVSITTVAKSFWAQRLELAIACPSCIRTNRHYARVLVHNVTPSFATEWLRLDCFVDYISSMAQLKVGPTSVSRNSKRKTPLLARLLHKLDVARSPRLVKPWLQWTEHPADYKPALTQFLFALRCEPVWYIRVHFPLGRFHEMSESKRKRVDVDRTSNTRIFSHEWAKALMALSTATSFDDAAFNLCASWKSTDNCHYLPHFMVENIASQVNSIADSETPLSLTIIKLVPDRLVKALAANQPGQKRSDKLNYAQRKRLRSEYDRLIAECQEALKSPSPKPSIDSTWNLVATAEEFKLCLWGTQRLCYAAFYYAYEDFVKECVGIRLGKSDYEKPRHDDFKRDIRMAFGDKGEEVLATCYTDAFITLARQIRDSLVHHGARLTKQLKPQEQTLARYGFMIEDGEIQVTATQTRALYERLSQAATKLLESATATATPLAD